ncbi:MAG: DUF1415 domain-containing protein [Chitinophagaceae bacterium]|nr:MAG: DUF1415 domain-containing protein [Chitinophagaceae bacterium]
MNTDAALPIAQTKKWILDVVVGCNFCPFALREVKRDSIRFEVVDGSKAVVIQSFRDMLAQLDADREIETAFIILPRNFARFTDYLKLVDAAETSLRRNGYEGVYQVASFHPDYLFAGSLSDDASNYTNRSPHPMLHILREESVSRAVDSHPDPLKIPERNMAFAREKGLEYMQRLWKACREEGV